MAFTRAQIKAQVISNTGKSNKDTLVETLCNLALEEACLRHAFEDCKSVSDLSVVADDTSVALPSGTIDLIAVSVIDADGDNAAPLIIKGETWYKKHIVIPDQFAAGWPKHAAVIGSTLYFDRPMDTSYTIRVLRTTTPTFSSDSAECPVAVLSVFVHDYVMAHVYNSLEDDKNYFRWLRKAVGSDFDSWSGGSFNQAVRADENKKALELSALDIAYPSSDNHPLFKTVDDYPWFRPG